MKVKTISYSESMKLTTGKRFESVLIHFGMTAEADTEGETLEKSIQLLKNSVKDQMKIELQNYKNIKEFPEKPVEKEVPKEHTEQQTTHSSEN